MTATPDVLPVVERADHVPGAKQGHWNYEHYAAIPDDGTRYEVIDGVLYMAPASSFAHQKTVALITTLLTIHVGFAGLGDVLVAPFDVELASGKTVVQPDVLVVLSEHRSVITPSHAVGAPDLVVEVASPSTASYDRRAKMDAYARAGVREYWIADPYAHTVELLQQENDAYRLVGVFQGQAILPSKVVPNLPVPLEQFFPA
jgi:Uma2 family endonuclease